MNGFARVFLERGLVTAADVERVERERDRADDEAATTDPDVRDNAAPVIVRPPTPWSPPPRPTDDVESWPPEGLS